MSEIYVNFYLSSIGTYVLFLYQKNQNCFEASDVLVYGTEDSQRYAINSEQYLQVYIPVRHLLHRHKKPNLAYLKMS